MSGVNYAYTPVHSCVYMFHYHLSLPLTWEPHWEPLSLSVDIAVPVPVPVPDAVEPPGPDWGLDRLEEEEEEEEARKEAETGGGLRPVWARTAAAAAWCTTGHIGGRRGGRRCPLSPSLCRS